MRESSISKGLLRRKMFAAQYQFQPLHLGISLKLWILHLPQRCHQDISSLQFHVQYTFHPIGALLTSAAESISERIRTLGRQHEQQVRPTLVSVILPNPQDMQKFQNPLFLGFTFDRHCQVFLMGTPCFLGVFSIRCSSHHRAPCPAGFPALVSFVIL